MNKANITKIKKLFNLLFSFFFFDFNFDFKNYFVFNWVSNQRLIKRGVIKITIIAPEYKYSNIIQQFKYLWSGTLEHKILYPKPTVLNNEVLIVEMKEVSKDIYKNEESVFRFTNKFKIFMAFVVSIFYFTTLSYKNVWNVWDLQIYYGYLVFLVSIFFSIDFLYMDDGEYPISCEMEKILLSNFPSDKHNLVKELILLINLHCKK